MNDEDKECIEDFIRTLHEVADDYKWQNTVALVSIAVYKAEQEITIEPVVEVDPNKRTHKRRPPLVGFSIQTGDGPVLIKLQASDKFIKISPNDRNFRAAEAFHLKLHQPSLSRAAIMEMVGYGDVSSVVKGIDRILGWSTTNVVPDGIDVIENPYY